jgi:hypothetical protein
MFHARESDGLDGPVSHLLLKVTLGSRVRWQILELDQSSLLINQSQKLGDDDTNLVEMLWALWTLKSIPNWLPLPIYIGLVLARLHHSPRWPLISSDAFRTI